MAKDLVIFGSGGFGREVLWLVEEINDASAGGAPWRLTGFLDDDQNKWGTEIDGLPVLGGMDWLKNKRDLALAIAVGKPSVRRQLYERAGAAVEFPALIHPGVLLSKRVRLGPGVLVCAGTILTTNITVERFSILNLTCTVGHDAVLGEFCTLSPGVHISGCVTVGAEAFVGTGAEILEGRKVGARTIIGAGAVVNSDIPEGVTAVGVPARVRS
ncbi:MAG: acetyltransferase [Oligoflexia bacterium]|nr:acetyltransferase [Oligoflexia bacterium]